MAPFVSDNETSDSETEVSRSVAPQRPNRAESGRSSMEPPYRLVTIILKDAHDSNGPGMKTRMPWTASFKNIFDHFKARSCLNCRATDEMRFKTTTALVSERDTPQSVRSLHAHDAEKLLIVSPQLGLAPSTTTEIKVWSNVPGLQCDFCRSIGYPRTNGVDYDLSSTRPRARLLLPKWTKPETISLHLRDQTGFETSVKTLNTVGFRYLMEQYATTALRDVRVCRFLFDGERIAESETPKQVWLTDPPVWACM